ncbi:MAG: ADOP family duplicated permease [Acidobacteriia bacterium]|nr:ADOP family duplicated permease [Terriglobia bacterium]
MKIYRWLIKLYPAGFREEYGAAVERQLQDEYRDSRGGVRFWLRAFADLAVSIPAQIAREMRQDLGYAARVYRRRLLPTTLAFAALALAIGAATGIFSVVNALLIRSLPFRDPGRLVEVQNPPVEPDKGRAAFYEWRDHSASLSDAAALLSADLNLSAGRGSAHVNGIQTSSNFFSLVGVEPQLGRAFAPDEDAEGRLLVAVISNALWQEMFGADPRALGTTVGLNGAPATIIGIAPPGFDFPTPRLMSPTAVWTPTAFDRKRLPGRLAFTMEPIGRLKPGIDLKQANAIMRAQAPPRSGSYILINPSTGKPDPNYGPGLVSIREQLAGPIRESSLVLMGIVVFVLLIACANVAHLLLSRVTERSRELAIRASLGASRARLVQQLMTESVALTAAAAAAGIAVAHWAARLATAAQPPQFSAQKYAVVDWRVLGFAAGVALLTGLLFGVLPAWLIGRVHPARYPLRSRAPSHGAGLRRVRTGLIALQAAITVVLVAGSVSMGRSFLKLLGTDLGFRTDRIVTMNVSLTGSRHEPAHTEREYFREALSRLRAVPGVESAGAVRNLPLTFGAAMQVGVSLDGGRRIGVTAVAATPDYFRTIGLDRVEGREFTALDGRQGEPVGIVDEALARKLGAPSGILGRKLRWGNREFAIAGVVKSARFNGPAQPGWEHFYYPVEADSGGLSWFLTFVARVRGRPEAYLAACRNAVQRIDPQVAVYDVKTFDQRLRDNLLRPRFYTTGILFFGVFSLLLAITGVYGVAAHSVAQRTHEIGVRIAVGASPAGLRLKLLREGLLPVAAGMAAGVAGAAALGQFLRHLMRSAEPVGAWTCAAGALLLAASAAMAVWNATRRVARMDPMAALRTE